MGPARSAAIVRSTSAATSGHFATAKQISALSGELYKGFAEGLEDNPVLTAEQWLRVSEMNEEARRGEYGLVATLGIHKSAEGRRRASMEKRFGKMANAFLAGRGIITDEASRWKLIEQASLDLSEAAKKLSRNADGDFTPDDAIGSFHTSCWSND